MAETTTPSFNSVNKSVKKTMDGIGATFSDFFTKTSDSMTKVLSQVSEPKLSKEKQDSASKALMGQFKAFEDLLSAVELNQDELVRMAESNEDAAKLLGLLKTEGFDDLKMIQQRMLNGQSISGDQIKLLNGTFDSTNATLQQMKDADNIDNLKQLNTLEFIKDSSEKFATGQAETQALMDEQIYESKTLREFIEENGILGEGGFGDSILALLGLGGLVGPFRKLIKIVKTLKSLKLADIVAKFHKYMKPFKDFGLMLKNFGSRLVNLGASFKKFKIVSTIFDKIGKFFSPIVKVFNKIKKVFQPVAKLFSAVSGFFSKFSAALKPALKIGKTAAKFARGIPVIGQILTVLIGAFDFFSGFKNADKIAGKAKEALTIGDKIMAGISEMISSITFGFVKSEDIFKFMDNALDNVVGGLMKAKDALVNFFTEGFGVQLIDHFIAPFKLAFDLVKGVGTSIWEGISNAMSGIFNAKSITEGLVSAFAGIASIWTGIGETVMNAVSSAIKGLTFGALDLGEFELPGFEDIVKNVKKILEVIQIPFKAIADTFGGLLSKADDLKKGALDGAGNVLDSISGFFGGNDDAKIEEEKLSKSNVINLEEKRMQLKKSPKEAVAKDQQIQRQAQERAIDPKPQTVVVQGGSGGSRPQAVASGSKQISVEDTRLAAANTGAFD